jgi:hypothetical protein
MMAAIPFPKPGSPEPDQSARPCNTFQYAVKVVVGIAAAAEPRQEVAPGRYFTACNIHNPSACTTVSFRWRVSVAGRIGAPMGVISAQQRITLRPGQSVEIDTPDILRATTSSFSKGFVVIESASELDIVAAYTVASLQGPASPLAFHTERVAGRLTCACSEDLAMDLSTGTANWSITSAVNLYTGSPLMSTPRPAATVLPSGLHPDWGARQDAQWISVNSFSNIPSTGLPGMIPGYYTFQTCFSLCSGYENARIELSMLIDDAAQVWLNSAQIGGIFLGPLSELPTHLQINQGFLPGLNCLTFVVRNDDNNADPNPVGINVKAALTALRGACPDCGCGSKDEQHAYSGAHAGAQP